MAKVTIRADVRGAAEIARAFRRLPEQGQREVNQKRDELAGRLAQLAAAAARADTRQSARVASTVRAARGAAPAIIAGPHPLLFGSEFGARGRYGWYARPRYAGSAARQFGPKGSGGRPRNPTGYWFFPTVEDNRAVIDEAWQQACDAIIRAWGGD